MMSLFDSYPIIKSPLNYTGGKYKLLPQLLPLFPQNINTFVDLFAGGCNVGVNAHAKKIICNDIIPYLIQIFNVFKETDNSLITEYINKRIAEYSLSATNEAAYKTFRQQYNDNPNPLDLYILIAHSFNYQLRFNSHHHYNNPFGKTNSTFNAVMRKNLNLFLDRVKSLDISFVCNDFLYFDFSAISADDFIYCDPPYLISTGAYNDGKRGFKGWSEADEHQLLAMLEAFDKKGIRFALSNVLFHKGKTNHILIDWIDKHKFSVAHLKKNYAASSYHTFDRNKNGSDEVLIMNY